MYLTKFIVIVFVIASYGRLAFGQEPDHPSTWPAPTLELIKSGYYTKEKQIQYWEWKEKTLSDLYLKFDSKNIELARIDGEKGRFQYRFNFKSLGMVFVVDHWPKKKRFAYIKEVEPSYLDTLDLKNYDWLSSFLKEKGDRVDRNCGEVETPYRDIYIIVNDPKTGFIKIFKSNYCECPCDDDEVVK